MDYARVHPASTNANTWIENQRYLSLLRKSNIVDLPFIPELMTFMSTESMNRPKIQSKGRYTNSLILKERSGFFEDEFEANYSHHNLQQYVDQTRVVDPSQKPKNNAKKGNVNL